MTPLVRDIPKWMQEEIWDKVKELTIDDPNSSVIPTRLSLPKAKDRETVKVRWTLIQWMHDTYVYKRDGEGREYRGVYATTPNCVRDALKKQGWKPLTRPDMGYILGLDQSTATHAMIQMKKRAKADRQGLSGDGM